MDNHIDCKYCGASMHGLDQKGTNKICTGGRLCKGYSSRHRVQVHYTNGKWFTGIEWFTYVNSEEVNNESR